MHLYRCPDSLSGPSLSLPRRPRRVASFEVPLGPVGKPYRPTRERTAVHSLEASIDERANGVLRAEPARLTAPYQRGSDVPTSQLDGGMSPAAPPRLQAPHLRRRRIGLHRSRSAGKQPSRPTSATLNARHHRRQGTAARAPAQQQRACTEASVDAVNYCEKPKSGCAGLRGFPVE